MEFIPNAVMIGFVNALAILIFMAQVPHFLGINNMTYVFVAITLLIVYIVPRFITAIPAPLIAIVLLTSFAIYGNVDLRTVGDLGSITSALPSFFIPDVPFTFETLAIIFPYSIALAIIGLLESLLTSTIVDDMTGTESKKNREARGQGIANTITGFFGGMAGCAMIGQSVINVKSGGRGRLSTFVAGAFLMFLIIVLGDLVVQVPMPVLVGIMIMVSIGTFDWSSFRYVVRAPKGDAAVMLVTVAIVVATDDLSKGVIAGVILSAIFFVAKISKVSVTKQQETDTLIFYVQGQLFFASVESFINTFDLSTKNTNIYLCIGKIDTNIGVFINTFDLSTKNTNICIDFSNAQIWDESGVGAIDKVMQKYRKNNNQVTLTGLNPASEKIIDKLAVQRI